MAPLIECVINISEGKNRPLIEAIAGAVETERGVKLLHIDASPSAHRSVITFAGPPDTIVPAAIALYERALVGIDMRQHHGVHPRIGAVDVTPFVPLIDATLDDCLTLSQTLAAEVARLFDLPVFLYGESATRPSRRSVAAIRKGEYEHLKARLLDPAWQPDAGPSAAHPTGGATIIGARPLLVAYNITLDSDDASHATAIARHIRESGYQSEPGQLAHCMAIGWWLEHIHKVQVSTNLTHFETTSPKATYDAVVREAASRGITVTGSEVVGLIPLRALLPDLPRGASAHSLIHSRPLRDQLDAAIALLSLDDLYIFHPEEKILEFAIEREYGICVVL